MSNGDEPEIVPAVEVVTGPAPRHAVLWLHGLGADGHDFEPVVPMLGLDPARPVRFVFPHAPVRAVTINAGMEMRAWFDVRSLEHDRTADVAGIRAATATVEQLIAREHERGIASERLVLAGFSQGGAMALYAGLRHRSRLAGIIALSCYLPLADRLAAEAAAANAGVPIFQAHGSVDPLVRPAHGEATAVLLGELGYPVDWRTYPIAHGVDPAELSAVGSFLDRLFD